MNGPTPQAPRFGSGDDDPDLRKDLAAKFMEESFRQLAQLRAALISLDGQSLKAAAHALMGSIAIFKDQAANDAALRMEHIGRDAEWSLAEDA